MTKPLFKYTTVAFTLFFLNTFSQTSSSMSSSPYSLYGLGVTNSFSSGKTNSLGKTGLALKSETEINNLNPASYANIGGNSFMFDLGINFGTELFTNYNGTQTALNANFSNIALAFAITKRSGLGITLSPYTNVGYDISNIESPIEGSSQTFISDAYGNGGLSELNLNYGYSINKKLNLGFDANFRFGQIQQTETNYISENTLLQIEDENNYSGLQLGLGAQYDINSNTSFGTIISFPATLSGNQTTTVSQNYADDDISKNKLDSFKLPLEIGLGIKTNLNDNFLLTTDYKREFWSNTNQSDYFGDYINRDVFGIGLQYLTLKSNFKYLNTIQYRAGINFDNGNLLIDNTRLNNYGINFGLGLPINQNSNSMINLNYSYGQRGTVSNGLIKENYHVLSINFSLEGIWFVKRKYN
ncbi:hypothetical protein A9Q86_09400 [Flavobacteriales bacterium 33_180_T64]|nr:hypothetical protein A9Q86_09400 [Flavobacteriales bacterium 33_180_T64]